MLLEMLGYEILIAYDAEAALVTYRQYFPEDVFLDIGLPGLDGYEVARRLRAYPELANSVLIAITGYGSPADRERAQHAGIDQHLLKPVEFEIVERILREKSERLRRFPKLI